MFKATMLIFSLLVAFVWGCLYHQLCACLPEIDTPNSFEEGSLWICPKVLSALKSFPAMHTLTLDLRGDWEQALADGQ